MKNDQANLSNPAAQTKSGQQYSTSFRFSKWIAVFILLDMALIYLLIKYPHSQNWPVPIPDEGYRHLWDFALVVAGGSFISFMLEKWKRDNEIREVERLNYRNLYVEAIAAYNGAKKYRRLLRAKAIYEEEKVKKVRMDQYFQLITELEDVQLNIEALERRAKEFDNISISNLFGEMQKYLGKICEDFETIQKEQEKTFKPEDSVQISSLENLEEFIMHSKERDKKYTEKELSPFYTKFKTPFEKIEKDLIAGIKK